MALLDKSGTCLNNNKSLLIDTACLSIVNENNYLVTFFSGFNDCVLCDGQPIVNLKANSNTTVQISTLYPLRFYYNETGAENPSIRCIETYSFKEHGRYGWNISSNGCSHVYTLFEPWNPYLPLVAALMVYILGFVLFWTSKSILSTVKTYLKKPTEIQGDLDRLQELETAPTLLAISRTATRMHALDAFRGIAVLLMIFVNSGGGNYVFLNHVAWNGLHVADLVLPWFAWAMGFTIVNSVRINLRIAVPRLKLIMKQLRRTITLILFGLLINSLKKPLLSEMRFPGVLQLLAISYFICSVIETCCAGVQRNFDLRRFGFLEDILQKWIQWIAVLIIVITHVCVTFLMSVPGCPRGYIGPGGYHHHGDYKNCTGGAAGYIDRLIFGNHMYMNKMNPVYGQYTVPHDPEGFMNTVSATLIVFMGVQAGHIFVTYYQANSRMIRWTVWSTITGITAGILCNFSKESGFIPVNKKMMSLSFNLCTSSFAFLLFTILYYFIDHKKFWSGAPFIYAGANPILLYVGHYLTKDIFPFEWKVAGTKTHTSVLTMNLWTSTLWTFIAYCLYKKDILITI